MLGKPAPLKEIYLIIKKIVITKNIKVVLSIDVYNVSRSFSSNVFRRTYNLWNIKDRGNSIKKLFGLEASRTSDFTGAIVLQQFEEFETFTYEKDFFP